MEKARPGHLSLPSLSLPCPSPTIPVCPIFQDSHVSLVVGTDLLDSDVVLGVDEGLSGGIGLGHGHHTGDVLIVMLVFHFDLWEMRG